MASLVGLVLDSGDVLIKFTETTDETAGTLHEAAAILREYRNEFRLAKPPAFVQTIVFSCLAPFGRAAVGAD